MHLPVQPSPTAGTADIDAGESGSQQLSLLKLKAFAVLLAEFWHGFCLVLNVKRRKQTR